MIEDTDLRKALVAFRENVLCPLYRSDSERLTGLLRRSMIDFLIERKPDSISEWHYYLPKRLRKHLNSSEMFKHGDAVVDVIRAYRATHAPGRSGGVHDI